MKIEFVKKEIIKPSSPTPSELKHFNLSLLDQFVASFYVPLILFFDDSDEEISNRLKNSLSETLTRFYPVAGRSGKDNNSSIDCNDEGVDYIEAKVNCLLSDFLKQPNLEQLFHFLPDSAEAMASSGYILKVQVTLFECGGMAIGLLFAHKLLDASSITTMLKSWSMTALGSNTETEPPEFMQASHIQPPQGISRPPMNKEPTFNCITQRLVFNSLKLNNLKSKASSETVQKPTSVEAVTSLIWKCAMKAAAKTTTTTNLSVITLMVNLRKRLTPPLSENSIGNLIGSFDTKPVPAGEKDLKELVQLLREGISEFNKNGIERYQGEDAFMKILGGLQESEALNGREDVASYTISSWSRFGLYDMDFGWGKPKWVISSGITMHFNFVLLMDMKDGEGIEACVNLKEEEMALFEKDEELLQFAYVNPSVIL